MNTDWDGNLQEEAEVAEGKRFYANYAKGREFFNGREARLFPKARVPLKFGPLGWITPRRLAVGDTAG
jgi:hypothetical protein